MVQDFAFDIGNGDLVKIVRVERVGDGVTVIVRIANQVVLQEERFAFDVHGEIETKAHGVGLSVRYRAPLASWLPLLIWRRRWF